MSWSRAADRAAETAAYERCRAMAIAFIEENGQITVADFRNLISASRKYAVPVLEHFDKIALTVRVDDTRRLRRKQG